jgi:hypothetical protein
VGIGLQRRNGRYNDQDGGGLAGELSVARAFHAKLKPGLVVGVNGGYQLIVGWNDCTLLPDGGCAPRLPDMRIVGALSGWESRTGSLRAMAGVAYVDPTSGGGAFALQARLDGAIRIVRHVALTASVRPVVIPSYRGDSFRLLGIGVGVRIR